MQFISYFLKSSSPPTETRPQDNEAGREDWEDWVQINAQGQHRPNDTTAIKDTVSFGSSQIVSANCPKELVFLEDYKAALELPTLTQQLPHPQVDDVWTLSTVVPHVQSAGKIDETNEREEAKDKKEDLIWKEIATMPTTTSANEAQIGDTDLHFNFEMDCGIDSPKDMFHEKTSSATSNVVFQNQQQEQRKSKTKKNKKKNKKQSPTSQQISPPINIPSSTQQSSPACSPPNLPQISTSGPASLSNPSMLPQSATITVTETKMPTEIQPQQEKQTRKVYLSPESKGDVNAELVHSDGQDVNPWYNPSDRNRLRHKLRVLSGEKI